MNQILRPERPIEYPESDGQPMGENTLQFEWIVTIKCGLEAVFRQDVNVFIAADLFWYPVEGDPSIFQAPDSMVVFGRPKGHRGSYCQWEEAGIPPQVVFEVRSPSNRAAQIAAKFQFYERYGVEEYYLYDPQRNQLDGWLRRGNTLEPIPTMNGWVSPRLRIRFELTAETLHIFGPDGKRFLTYLELVEQSEQAHQRAERLAAQLRALGIEPEA